MAKFFGSEEEKKLCWFLSNVNHFCEFLTGMCIQPSTEVHMLVPNCLYIVNHF